MQSSRLKKRFVWILVGVLFTFVWRGPASFSAENERRLNSLQGFCFPYKTTQPIDFNWNWDVLDFDTSYPAPYDPYSFHQYAKAEVIDEYLYVAKGLDTPSQLLCIHQATGTIVWEYSTELQWNLTNPFVCLDHEIIVNYQTAILLLDKKTGERKQKWDLVDDKKNLRSAFFSNIDRVLVEDSSQNPPLITCLRRSTFSEIWSYQPPENFLYRIVGVRDSSLLLIEFQPLDSPPPSDSLSSSSANTNLCSFSLETGERSDLTTWENICRIDYCRSSDEIDFGILNREGEGSIYSLTKTKKDPLKMIEVSKNYPLLSKEDCINVPPSLAVEDDLMGYRIFHKGEDYYVAVCKSIHESESAEKKLPGKKAICEKLCVYKMDKKGEIVWAKTFSSIEKCDGIVSDAFVQEDFLVFQFPYRDLFSADHTYAFWIDLETGNKVQTFYHFVGYLTDNIAECVPVFLPGIVLQTSCLQSNYLISIQAFSYDPDTFIRSKEIQIETTEVILEKLHFEPPIEEDSQTVRMNPFAHENWICFFQVTYDYQDNLMNIELCRYDVVKQEVLPTLSFEYQECDDRFDALYLLSDSLVLGSIDTYSRQMIVCFDIEKGEIIWEKEAILVDRIGDSILYRNPSVSGYTDAPPNTEFTLFHPQDNKVLCTIPFSTSVVNYVGSNENHTALFQRDIHYISQFDLFSGKLEEEIILSDREIHSLRLVDGYLLFFSNDGIAGCIDIYQKKLLWKRNIGNLITDFYQGSFEPWWKIQPLEHDEALIYNEEGCTIIELKNGDFLREYANPELRIQTSCQTDSNCPLFQLYSKNETSTCLQLNLDSTYPSELLQFPALDVEYDDVLIQSFTIQGQQYFVQHEEWYHGFLCISQYPSPQENALNHSFVDIGLEVSNYLYSAPFLIFQTSLGQKNSDYYLVAFHTEDGTITKIHKGFHERVYIQDDQLYFSQYGDVFTCPLGKFDAVEPTVYKEKPPTFSSKDPILPVKNYQEGVPQEYAPLDLYYINKIAFGSFTQSDQEELIFITGDDASVKIGVMGEKEGLVVPILTASYEPKDIDKYENGGCCFYQSILFDIDADGLEELILLTEYYIIVWDYSQKNETIVVYEMLYRSSGYTYQERELILYEGSLYFQSYQKKWREAENQLIQYCIEYIPTSKSIYSLASCFLELPSGMYRHECVQNLSPFQFLEKPVQNKEMYVEMIPTKCNQYPETSMPSILEPNTEELNEKELQYCKNRNECFQEFLSYLKEGNDPFMAIQFWLYSYPGVSLCNLSLSPKEETDLLVTHIYSFDVLQKEEKHYFLLRINSEVNIKFMVLLSAEWELCDVRYNTSYWDVSDQANIIISEEHPDYYWIQFYNQDEEPLSFLYGNVSNDEMNWIWRLNTYGIQQKEGTSYFTITDCGLSGILGDLSHDYGNIYDLQYRDPFSGTSVNRLFFAEISEHMEAYYSTFLMKQTRILSYGSNGSLDKYYSFDLPDHRYKSLYLTSYAKTLLKLEYFLRKYE